MPQVFRMNFFPVFVLNVLFSFHNVDGKKSKAKHHSSFKYYPMQDVEEDTLICPSTRPKPSSGSSSFSVWGFMTAAVVATTVAANLVNNVNNNNNNNNNNDNQNNQNQNSVNSNSDDNSNTNMNLILPGRSFYEDPLLIKAFAKEIKSDCFLHLLCQSFNASNSDPDLLENFLRKALNLAAGLILTDLVSDEKKLSDKDVILILNNSKNVCQELKCLV